ncbi:MAG: hypothetical protein Q7R96_05890 [Nanoarchaeota archaeon]|nr:hypothetical protein [Nanoarchaeota archaeon]
MATEKKTMMCWSLNIERLNIEHIVAELFDFSRPGAVSIPEVVQEEQRQILLNQIRHVQESPHNPLHAVQREVGQVVQEMQTFYITSDGCTFPSAGKDIWSIIYALQDVAADYAQIHRKLGVVGNFSHQYFNSIGLHYYPQGSLGITPHQDYASDVDIVANFILEGSAPFFVCKNRKGDDPVQLDASPGSLILMRAARCEEEQRFRPFHYVQGPMQENRYTVLIRTRNAERYHACVEKYEKTT